MEGETVIAGVDTHKDVHVLCLLDGLGRKMLMFTKKWSE